jgi:hypothetical protein
MSGMKTVLVPLTPGACLLLQYHIKAKKEAATIRD